MLEELKKELKELNRQWDFKLSRLWESRDKETDDRIHAELDANLKRSIEIREEIYRLEEED